MFNLLVKATIKLINNIKNIAIADPKKGLYIVPINCDSINSPNNTLDPPPNSLGIKKQQEQETKTMEVPDNIPGKDNGNIIYLSVVKLFAPRSSLASIKLSSILDIAVYIGKIINGRKSYAITNIIAIGVFIIFIVGRCASLRRLFKIPFFSSMLIQEYVLRSRFVHIGSVIKTINIFLFKLLLILLAKYETGYAIIKQRVVARVVYSKDLTIILK